MKSKNEHEQTEITTADGIQVKVDERMAPLLKRLWKHGIKTNFSCQGNRNAEKNRHFEIAFTDDGHVASEMWLGRYSRDDAYIAFCDLESARAFSEKISKRTWRWNLGKPSAKSDLKASVHFPAKDIPAIERAFSKRAR